MKSVSIFRTPAREWRKKRRAFARDDNESRTRKFSTFGETRALVTRTAEIWESRRGGGEGGGGVMRSGEKAARMGLEYREQGLRDTRGKFCK